MRIFVPASYHRAFASANFLKTHAIEIATIQPSPRAPSKKFLIQTPNGFRWTDHRSTKNSFLNDKLKCRDGCASECLHLTRKQKLKKSVTVIALTLVSLSACVTAGTAIYKWLASGDKITCVANEFTFGCRTTFGWVLAVAGVVIFAIDVYLWERYRGN